MSASVETKGIFSSAIKWFKTQWDKTPFSQSRANAEADAIFAKAIEERQAEKVGQQVLEEREEKRIKCSG